MSFIVGIFLIAFVAGCVVGGWSLILWRGHFLELGDDAVAHVPILAATGVFVETFVARMVLVADTSVWKCEATDVLVGLVVVVLRCKCLKLVLCLVIYLSLN